MQISKYRNIPFATNCTESFLVKSKALHITLPPRQCNMGCEGSITINKRMFLWFLWMPRHYLGPTSYTRKRAKSLPTPPIRHNSTSPGFTGKVILYPKSHLQLEVSPLAQVRYIQDTLGTLFKPWREMLNRTLDYDYLTTTYINSTQLVKNNLIIKKFYD